jgi:hypothetical protein
MQSLFDLSAAVVIKAPDFETLQQRVPEEVLKELKFKKFIPQYCSKAPLPQRKVIKLVKKKFRKITKAIQRRDPIDRALVLLKKRTRLSLFLIYNMAALHPCQEVTQIIDLVYGQTVFFEQSMLRIFGHASGPIFFDRDTLQISGQSSDAIPVSRDGKDLLSQHEEKFSTCMLAAFCVIDLAMRRGLYQPKAMHQYLPVPMRELHRKMQEETLEYAEILLEVSK